MINAAGTVVVTAVPFGEGNLRNLEAAVEALKRGIPTYVIDEVPIEQRDFTSGKATNLMAELKKKGAVIVSKQCDLLPLLDLPDKDVSTLSSQQTLPGHTKVK
jgi:iron complex transport system ATP-binding protein